MDMVYLGLVFVSRQNTRQWLALPANMVVRDTWKGRRMVHQQ